MFLLCSKLFCAILHTQVKAKIFTISYKVLTICPQPTLSPWLYLLPCPLFPSLCSSHSHVITVLENAVPLAVMLVPSGNYIVTPLLSCFYSGSMLSGRSSLTILCKIAPFPLYLPHSCFSCSDSLFSIALIRT